MNEPASAGGETDYGPMVGFAPLPALRARQVRRAMNCFRRKVDGESSFAADRINCDEGIGPGRKEP